jgi:hypothetical protein
MVFVPFHWGDLFGEGNAANYLTISAIGRVAKQPELKFCAVALEKVPSPIEMNPFSRDAESSGRIAQRVLALRSEDSASRLNGD